MANSLVVTQEITISVGNSIEFFEVDDVVPSNSIYAPVLLAGGWATQTGAPEDPEDPLLYTELNPVVIAVYHGEDATTPRPSARFVVWIGTVTPDNAFVTDLQISE